MTTETAQPKYYGSYDELFVEGNFEKKWVERSGVLDVLLAILAEYDRLRSVNDTYCKIVLDGLSALHVTDKKTVNFWTYCEGMFRYLHSKLKEEYSGVFTNSYSLRRKEYNEETKSREEVFDPLFDVHVTREGRLELGQTKLSTLVKVLRYLTHAMCTSVFGRSNPAEWESHKATYYVERSRRSSDEFSSFAEELKKFYATLDFLPLDLSTIYTVLQRAIEATRAERAEHAKLATSDKKDTRRKYDKKEKKEEKATKPAGEKKPAVYTIPASASKPHVWAKPVATSVATTSVDDATTTKATVSKAETVETTEKTAVPKTEAVVEKPTDASAIKTEDTWLYSGKKHITVREFVGGKVVHHKAFLDNSTGEYVIVKEKRTDKPVSDNKYSKSKKYDKPAPKKSTRTVTTN